LITPAFSIAITIAAPIGPSRSAAGLKYSSLARMVALTPCACRQFAQATIGVSPIASTMESKTRPAPDVALHSWLTTHPSHTLL
jgi:hypothetical protein